MVESIYLHEKCRILLARNLTSIGFDCVSVLLWMMPLSTVLMQYVFHHIRWFCQIYVIEARALLEDKTMAIHLSSKC